MNCPNCNSQIAINCKFCPICGYQFNNKAHFINPNTFNQVNMNQNIPPAQVYNESINVQNNQNLTNDDILIKEYIGKNADKIISSN